MLKDSFNRRRFLMAAAAGAGAMTIGPSWAASPNALLTRPIPKTGERIPIVGMGTWITFNVGNNTGLRNQRAEVLREFFNHGGGMIDSSPMYGSAEEVLGYCFDRLDSTDGLFSATKVWTPSADEGPVQVTDSQRLWGLDKFDLFQVHNLLNWESHLPMLLDRKAAGDIRYVGVTTSHGGRHDGIIRMMQRGDVDFAQFTYNIVDRKAEDRLLPMAADLGVATIINRPFQRGALPRRFAGETLPAWAADYGMNTWGQFLLKFVISHPAVTCAIPATSRVDHMTENMMTMRDPMPDAATRRKMIDYVESL